MRHRFSSVGAVVVLLGSSRLANAQSNYRLAPIGGRSQLLGGTGMAYGRDATASFLNPATAVLVDDSRLSFSVNFYQMTYVYAPRWYTPGPIDRSKFGDLKIDSPGITGFEFSALPSSLCIFFRAADIPFVHMEKDSRAREGRIGLCFAMIQSQSFSASASGLSEAKAPSIARQAQTLSQSYTRFAVGPTYAMQVTNALAIGASLHGSIASHRSLIAASATTYGSSPDPITSMFYNGARGDSFQLEGILGTTLRWGHQTVGLSIKSPSVHVYGLGGVNQQSHFEGAGRQTSVLSASGSFVSRSPMRVGIGSGIEASWGQAEFNAFYSPPLDSTYTADLQGTHVVTGDGGLDDQRVNLNLGERSAGVVNFAVGGELFVSDHISMLSGLSTDLSAVPKGGLHGSLFNYHPYRTHRVAGSFGLASHGAGGEILVGGELSVGWGERLAVNSYQLPPVIGTTGHGTYQMLFVIAGSTSIRAIKRAVHDVQQVITQPNPSPQNPGVPRKPAEKVPRTTPYNPLTSGASPP